MSVMGSIQPAETSKTTPEMIDRLSVFLDLDEKTTSELHRQSELVEDYLRNRGSLTLEATRSLLQTESMKPSLPKDLHIEVFRSTELPKHAEAFLKSDAKKQGWITSHYIPFKKELHPHQMPIFVEKCEDKIICTIFDTRGNWEKIRNSLMKAFIGKGHRIQFYLSTERRQFDWSTCSILSLDDLRKINEMDRSNLYSFFEEHYTSIEVSRDQSWSLTVTDHLPPIFMELVQSLDDFDRYQDWAKDANVDSSLLERIKGAVTKHLSGLNKRLNGAIIQRFKHVLIEVIIPKIQSGVHPRGCSHLQHAYV